MTAPPTAACPDLDELEAYLHQLIADCAPSLDPPQPRGRPRILPACVLWTGLLVCVLRGFSSQLELWRLLSSGRFWDYPRYAIDDQAVYKRLAEGGTAPLAQLFSQLSSVLRERLLPLADQRLAPFASQVVVIDESTLDPVARRLPSLRGLPTVATLPGKLAGCFDIRLQQWQRLIFCPDARQNEKVLARALVADLPVGSLILADLGYFGFAWFDELTETGQWWLSRWRAKTSCERVHTFYEDGDTLDALIWLGAYRADRAGHLVRLVQFRHGQQLRRYLTNVTEPRQLSMQAVAALYARRWDIELAVQLVKEHLGLGLLWSSKAVVIQQQLWAVLIIAQLVQALRVEVAARGGGAVRGVIAVVGALPAALRGGGARAGGGLCRGWATFGLHAAQPPHPGDGSVAGLERLSVAAA